MKIIIGQFDKQSGPDAVEQFKLTFSIDESQQDRFYDFCKSVKKGSELMLMIYDVAKEEAEVKELVTETPEETKTRLNKRLHAMMSEIAKEKNKKPEEIKKILKEWLIQKGYIKVSSAELDIKGFASAIYFLQTEFHDSLETELEG